MKKFLCFTISLTLLLTIAGITHAEYVEGYFRDDGTYVEGHYRSKANGIKFDNYSWEPGDDLYNESFSDLSYSSEWREPAWNTQSDYFIGLNSYRVQNDYDGIFSSSLDVEFEFDTDFEHDLTLDSFENSNFEYGSSPNHDFEQD